VTIRTPDGLDSNQSALNVDAAPTLLSLDQNSRTAGNVPLT
jgi:hypothetical protein